MLVCFSVSHRHADFTVLEELERRADRMIDALTALKANGSINGAVPLITCNRFELYLDAPASDAAPASSTQAHDAHAMSRWVAQALDIDAALLVDQGSVLTHEAVAKHLFAVASGMDSVVVGEDEIVGQVRRARDLAESRHELTSALDRLFQRASRVSKQIKSQTSIAQQGRSLVTLALTLADTRIPDWTVGHVLLIGTGKFAGATLVQLRRLGVEDLRVWSPSGRQVAFATRREAVPVMDDDLPLALAMSDLIISCTAVKQPVLKRAQLARAQALQSDRPRPQLIIDLGMPRNVDPAVDTLDNVALLDLDTIRTHAALDEFSGVADAEAVIADALTTYRADQRDAEIAPDLVALRRAMLDVVDREVERHRTHHALTPELEAALRHLGSTLLHDALSRAHAAARRGDTAAVHNAISALYGTPDLDNAQRDDGPALAG